MIDEIFIDFFLLLHFILRLSRSFSSEIVQIFQATSKHLHTH